MPPECVLPGRHASSDDTGLLLRRSALPHVHDADGATVADRLTFLPFDIRMNKAAHDSLVAAMKI